MARWYDIGPAVELRPGDFVKLYGEMQGSQDGKTRYARGKAEYGIVIQTHQGEWQDCIVAFVGHKEKDFLRDGVHPYILRYHYTSLQKISCPLGNTLLPAPTNTKT